MTDVGKTGKGSLKWWPAMVITGLFVASLIWIWARTDALNRQNQVMSTIGFGMIAVILLSLWVLFLCGLPWRNRLKLFFPMALLMGIAVFALKIEGVSGNLVPQLQWRWQGKQDESLTVDTAVSGVDKNLLETARGNDFPQFLGPNRNGILTHPNLSRDWTGQPPKKLWRQPIGAGWSGFAIVGSLALTQEQRGEYETVSCYALQSGELLWTHKDSVRFESTIAGDGPRATPTVVDGMVYSLGATGILNCLELVTGARQWSVNILEDNDALVPTYAVCASPLVLDDEVIVLAGGFNDRSLVSYHRTTGQRLWSGGNGPAAYSSPFLATLAGTPQIVVFHQSAVAGQALQSGKVLWEYPWPSGTEITSQPVPLPGDRLFVSSGYGIGGKMFQVAKSPEGDFSVDLIWETTRLKAKFTNIIFYDGFLYGLDDGVMVCLDPTTGQRKWKGGRYNHGQILLVGDLLLVLAEDGRVILLEPNPKSLTELGQFQAIEGKTWNHMALSGPHLLVRNATEAACYQLPVTEETGPEREEGSPGSQ